MSEAENQTIAIHILPNISRSKGNRTMKFGQLIEYNMKTFFLKNHTQNMMEKAFPDSFLKYQNWACLWTNSLKFYTVYFIACKVEGSRNMLKLSCRLLAFTSRKAFLKSKEKSEASLPPSFSSWFFISLVYSINWPHFIVWLPWLREILGNMWRFELQNQNSSFELVTQHRKTINVTSSY